MHYEQNKHLHVPASEVALPCRDRETVAWHDPFMLFRMGNFGASHRHTLWQARDKPGLSLYDREPGLSLFHFPPSEKFYPHIWKSSGCFPIVVRRGVHLVEHYFAIS
jgi:hypothetical protein